MDSKALFKANMAWLRSSDRDAVAFNKTLKEFGLSSWQEYDELRLADVDSFKAFQRAWTDNMLLVITRSPNHEEACLDRAALYSLLENIVTSRGSSDTFVPTPPSPSEQLLVPTN